MKRLLVVPLAVAVLIAWSGYSHATACEKGIAMAGMYGMHGVHMMMPGRVMMERLGTLGLDKEQTAEVKTIIFRAMKEGIKKKADMGVAEIELRELFLKEPADFKAVEAKVRQIETLRGDIVILRLKAREEIRSKLTAEQREKFDSLTATPMPGMMPNGGWGMRGRDGFPGGMEDMGFREWGRCRMMDGRGMMDDGMMRMQPYEESPFATDETEQGAAGDDMSHRDMEHQQMQR